MGENIVNYPALKDGACERLGEIFHRENFRQENLHQENSRIPLLDGRLLKELVEGV